MITIKLWLRSLAWWVLGNVKPAETDVDAALRAAYNDAGMASANFYPEYVLGTKLHEVLLHASRHLGNPLVTLNDVRELLR
jgi:hypothetical protein